LAEVNGAACQASKKLNVFAQMPPKPSGIAMFSKARLDTLSDGIFGVAMTLLILDVRLPEDFHPEDGAELVRGLLGSLAEIPALLSFGVLSLRLARQ
jgi:Endosomal/lysosomal potassium channel TMEM175